MSFVPSRHTMNRFEYFCRYGVIRKTDMSANIFYVRYSFLEQRNVEMFRRTWSRETYRRIRRNLRIAGQNNSVEYGNYSAVNLIYHRSKWIKSRIIGKPAGKLP